MPCDWSLTAESRWAYCYAMAGLYIYPNRFSLGQGANILSCPAGFIQDSYVDVVFEAKANKCIARVTALTLRRKKINSYQIPYWLLCLIFKTIPFYHIIGFIR